MAERQDATSSAARIAAVYQELAKAEQNAVALEKQLDDFEAKMDDLLAQAEENSKRLVQTTNGLNEADEKGSKAIGERSS